jgi:hypothetical protein
MEPILLLSLLRLQAVGVAVRMLLAQVTLAGQVVVVQQTLELVVQAIPLLQLRRKVLREAQQ